MNITVGQPENYEEKTLCVLVVDDSGSMSGDPIQQLNNGLKSFFKDIPDIPNAPESLEIGIIKYGTNVEVVRKPALVSSGEEPPVFTGDSGFTALNAAAKEAIKMVEERKEYYDKNNIPRKRPWIILLTDGAPTDGEVSGTARMIEEDTKNKKYVFLPIGVKGADMDVLNKLAGYIYDSEGRCVKSTALPLDGAKFKEFFKWLSTSIGNVVNTQDGKKVDLPDPTSWLAGMTA